MARLQTGVLVCLGLCLALTLLLGAGVLFAGRTFVPTDFLTTRAPWGGLHESDAGLKNRNAQDILEFDAVQAIGAAESLKRGELHLWDSRLFCGWAAVGDPQLGTFYPPRLLLLRLLPPLLALDLLLLLHFLGAGLAMYALAREWGVREAGALVGSLTWILCGVQCVWLRYAGGLPAAVYLPLMALALRRGLVRQRFEWVAGAGAAWALLLISAHPQLSFLALVWAVACLGAHLHRGNSRWTVKAALLFGVAGAGLAALQLFPFLESLRLSQKAAFTDGVGFGRPFRAPLLLLTLIWQRAYGSPFDRVDLTPELTGDNFFNLQAYMGILPLFLAILAWKRSRFLWIVALACLAFATCYPLWWLVVKLAPPLRVLDPHRLYLFAFAVSILAGLGFEELLDRPPGRGLRLIGAAGAALVLLLGVVGVLRSATWISIGNPAYLALAIATSTAAAAVWFAGGPARPELKTWVACGAILADLLPGLLAYNATYAPLPPEPALLAKIPRDERVQVELTTPYYGIEFGNFAALYGLSTAEGYGSQFPKAYAELAEALGGKVEERRVRLDHRETAPSVFNIRTVVDAVGAHTVYTLPRAWLVGQVKAIPDREARLNHLATVGFRYDRTAILEEEGPPLEGAPTGDVERVGRNEYRVNSIRPCFLVISENHHPGWHATVDGVETRVYRTDHTLQGIPVPAGTHQVVLTFRPGSVRWGLIVSVGTLLLLGLGAFAARRLGGG